MKNSNIKSLVQLAVLTAVMLALNLTGLGLVVIPGLALKVTTLHIPVIIAGCIMGPKAGGIMGFLFGLLSFINNSFIAPTITSFVFTPLYSLGDYSGNFGSILICFVPRILIGVFAGLLFKALQSKKINASISGILSGIAGSLTNTLLVMGGIALVFGQQYMEATSNSGALLVVIGTSILVNGVPEAIIAGILTAVIVTPLLRMQTKS